MIAHFKNPSIIPAAVFVTSTEAQLCSSYFHHDVEHVLSPLISHISFFYFYMHASLGLLKNTFLLFLTSGCLDIAWCCRDIFLWIAGFFFPSDVRKTHLQYFFLSVHNYSVALKWIPVLPHCRSAHVIIIWFHLTCSLFKQIWSKLFSSLHMHK